MRLQAYDDNGTMKFRQVSGSQALDSLPVGTAICYSGSVAPNGYLFCDGSTFDAAKYPELYSKLGTDTLPVLFDHNRRDTAYTNIRSQVGNTVQTAYEMPYDGDITISGSGWSQNYCGVYVLRADGTTLDYGWVFAGSYDSASAAGGTAIFLNKGDKFYATANNSSRSLTIVARFYKQHLLIKAATIGISDIDINTIKDELTYSTEETMTGKTWIDGKPIYRKTYYSSTNWASNNVIGTLSNVSEVVNISSVSRTTGNEAYQNYSDGSSRNDAYFNFGTGELCVRRTAVFVDSYPAHVTIEYTKQ